MRRFSSPIHGLSVFERIPQVWDDIMILGLSGIRCQVEYHARWAERRLAMGVLVWNFTHM